MTPLELVLAGAIAGYLLHYVERATVATSKTKPFNLGAATAAKLAVNGGAIEFELGDETFTLPSAAKWSEDQLGKTKEQTPFEVMRDVLGDDFDRFAKAAEKADPDNGFSFTMATELMKHYFEASGLGGPGE